MPENTPTSSGKSGNFPPELAGWNWGAFFMGWIWALGMSSAISFILCFFLSGIGNIVVGIKGNEWAWNSRKFDSVEQFKAVQHTWAIWGVVLLIIGIVVGGGILLISLLIAGSAVVNTTTPGI